LNGKDEARARLLDLFRAEAREHLDTLTRNLLMLERGLRADQAAGVLEETYRATHTLKGAARSVDRTDIEAVCRACESVLRPLARGGVAPGLDVVRALGRAVDGIVRILDAGDRSAAAELVRHLESETRNAVRPDAAPVPAQPAPREPSAPSAAPVPETLRVATARLDTLLLHAEEMLAPRLAAAERVAEVRSLLHAISDCRRSSAAASKSAAVDREASGSVAMALGKVEAQARELLGRLVHDDRSLAAGVDALDAGARQLRMSPAATVLDLFPAMARDLARQQGKEIDWVGLGAELEVDRKVLEAIKDPLIHLARNAVDHGIEPPDERARAGKPRRGRIAIALAPAEGGRVEIRVEDDGRGIDPARVRAAAVRCGVASPEEVEALTDEQALRLVYASGLTTSPMITDLSGHGLGLAIVRQRVEGLGGELRLTSGVGEGTTVSMVLPATVASFRGLLVSAGGLLFLLPTDAIERAVRVDPREVRMAEGRETILRGDEPVALARLAALLGLPCPEEPEGARDWLHCVVLRSGPDRLAVAVAEVLGEREVLVKPLRPPLGRVPHVSGAGLLGSGQLALILRPADLFASAREPARPARPAAAPKERALRVLVVDDSITTRTMEKNLLEAAGYEVSVAVDGAEAWTQLKTEPVDLVVSDLDMPRMDGFELTLRIRADQALSDLPVVLVTALESREDKERGVEVGANAYVVKSSFDQSSLLEIIRRLA
jgi:two-component system chemotaxis sensor kinase CheA